MNWFTQPWPWWIAGPLLGLAVPALLLLVGKPFGVSSSFRHLDSICSPGTRIEYLRSNNWRAELWNLFFVVGIAIGAFLAARFLVPEPVLFLPDTYRSWSGVLLLLGGGILIGFGTRYADGCTSGHTIMGIANLNWPSLVASLFFFVGGLFFVWIVRPLFG
jgi:uncharacterized membrane protein YedE/YeeE